MHCRVEACRGKHHQQLGDYALSWACGLLHDSAWLRLAEQLCAAATACLVPQTVKCLMQQPTHGVDTSDATRHGASSCNAQLGAH